MSSTPLSSSHDTWTDDLTIQCVHTGLGCSKSKLYSREDDQTSSLHEYMHKSFGFELKSDYLYGILTGFNNTTAVKFFTTHLPLVISDRINNDTFYNANMLNSSEEEAYYTNLLHNAFQTVEQQFLNENENELNEKTFIDIQLQEDAQNDPKIFDRLNELSSKLSSGLSAIVALIHNNRIYIANVGNTKAILCKKIYCDNGQECITSVELSTNHDLENLVEVERWKQIGVTIDENNKATLTRCLGNLWLKSFYKDYPNFASATQDPILATPDIVSISIDSSCLFLILTSGSLLSSLKEATGNSYDYLVKMVCDEFDINTNLNQISQSIVDQICEKHQECFYTNINSPTGNSRTKCRQIDDITILIRNLKIENKTSQIPIPIINISSKLDELTLDVTNTEQQQQQDTSTIIDNDKTLVNCDSNDCEVNSDNENDEESDQEDEEIDAYVDFSDYFGD